MNHTPSFGAFGPSGGGTYRLGQSIGTSDTSIKLSSFKEPTSNIPYTMSYLNSATGYGTLSPQSSISEFISFSGITQNSDGSAVLTGVTRGLSRTPAGSSCVASTTLATSHAGQSIFILSNSPCFYAEYAVKQNNETISGTWTFNTASPPQYSAGYTASGNQFVSFAQLSATAIQGAPTSTFSALGLVRLATSLQVGSSTASSTNGLQGGSPLVIPSKFSTTTPGILCTGGVWNCIPVAQVSGKIAQAWLDLTAAFTWTGTHIFSGAVQIAAAGANTLSFNGLAYTFPAGRAASSTVLSEDGAGNLTFESPQWQLLQSTTTSQVMNYATSTFTARTFLHIYISNPGCTVAQHLDFQFNNDASANYGWSTVETYGNASGNQVGGDTLIRTINGATTSQQIIVADIVNQTASRKLVTGSLSSSNTGAAAPMVDTFAGVWNNTSAPITSIVLTCNRGGSSAQINTGTLINVYGSSN